MLMPHHSLNGLLNSSSGSLLLLNGEKNGHILITKPYFLRGSSVHKDTVYEILQSQEIKPMIDLYSAMHPLAKTKL